MKLDEIVQLPEIEISQHLDDALEELQNLKFQHATHQLDNPLRIRMVRRDIARLKTVLHEIELGIRKPIKQTTE
jgi:large subunit ribosomal protein L29